ncbi:AraC family transcriptional regulator [Dysgonomonas sp. ZJ709]|uniref:helix-turn-helix domain-containing protein n=1 Tax=Dysgonomonas sp. ZJ709 TaxID=2709797 RepID=UPI0013EB20EC|nr:AraC family transcriptional regulator [Dysgonomonas sp. ZJ709]
MHGTKENLDLILLNVGYSELNANWNWKKIYSPFARIYYIKDGIAKTNIANQTYILEPNHLYLTPPFTEHDDECDSYFSLFYIHFYENLINKESVFDKFDFPIGIKATPLDLLLTERLLKINPDRHLRHFDPQLYDNPPTFSQYVADNNKMPLHSVVETQGILSQLMSRFLELVRIKTYDKDSRINKSLKYIHENIDKNISISDLSDAACISEDHFIRIFKNVMNQTPVRYINLKKIEKAQLLLLTTERAIRDIAFDLSIDNISYFNRVFKQYMNMTPSKYRKKYSK